VGGEPPQSGRGWTVSGETASQLEVECDSVTLSDALTSSLPAAVVAGHPPALQVADGGGVLRNSPITGGESQYSLCAAP
jgi:hypothetical protein